MRKLAILFLLYFIFSVFAACSVPLEGIGVKPELVKDVRLSEENGSLTVSWDKVYLADSYLVYYSEEQNIPAKPYKGVKEPSVTIPDLLNDITYYVWVASSNKLGTLAPKNMFSGTIPLSAPTGVSLRKTAVDTLELSWDSVKLAEEYEVFCKTNPVPPNDTDTPTQTVSLPPIILNGLDQPVYYIWVRAKNSRGVSALSEMAQDSFAISNFRVSAAAETLVTLAWDPLNGASGYNIYRSNSENGIYTKINTNAVIGAEYTDAGLETLAAYYYRISAIINGVEGAPSNPVLGSTLLPAPVNVRVILVTNSSVRITWNAYSGANGYNVYRSNSVDGIYAKINNSTINGTEFYDTGINPYTVFYKVSAVSGGVESMQSNPATIPSVMAQSLFLEGEL